MRFRKDYGVNAPRKVCFDTNGCDVAVATGVKRTICYSSEIIPITAGTE